MLVGRSSLARCGALAFQPLTLCSAAIEASIFISQAVWLFRTRKIRQRAKEAELDWDDFLEAQAWQDNRWRLPSIWRGSSVSTGTEMIEGDAAVCEQGGTPMSGMMRDRKEEIEQCRQ